MSSRKVMITNIANGPRGVNAIGGSVLLDPGQSVEVELSEAEAADLSKDWFKVGAKPAEDKKG